MFYIVETIKSMLDGQIDALHFDQVWLPHATFHDFYQGMHAIGKDRPHCKESMIFATQSTHNMLAGWSQASQSLIQDSDTRTLDRDIFDEAYLMHTSTVRYLKFARDFNERFPGFETNIHGLVKGKWTASGFITWIVCGSAWDLRAYSDEKSLNLMQNLRCRLRLFRNF